MGVTTETGHKSPHHSCGYHGTAKNNIYVLGTRRWDSPSRPSMAYIQRVSRPEYSGALLEIQLRIKHRNHQGNVHGQRRETVCSGACLHHNSQVGNHRAQPYSRAGMHPIRSRSPAGNRRRHCNPLLYTHRHRHHKHWGYRIRLDGCRIVHKGRDHMGGCPQDQRPDFGSPRWCTHPRVNRYREPYRRYHWHTLNRFGSLLSRGQHTSLIHTPGRFHRHRRRRMVVVHIGHFGTLPWRYSPYSFCMYGVFHIYGSGRFDR